MQLYCANDARKMFCPEREMKILSLSLSLSRVKWLFTSGLISGCFTRREQLLSASYRTRLIEFPLTQTPVFLPAVAPETNEAAVNCVSLVSSSLIRVYRVSRDSDCGQPTPQSILRVKTRRKEAIRLFRQSLHFREN